MSDVCNLKYPLQQLSYKKGEALSNTIPPKEPLSTAISFAKDVSYEWWKLANQEHQEDQEPHLGEAAEIIYGCSSLWSW